MIVAEIQHKKGMIFSDLGLEFLEKLTIESFSAKGRLRLSPSPGFC